MNGYARVGFGAIVDKTDSTVTIAEIARGNDYYNEFYSDASHQAEFEIADDVKVYVYDYNYKNSATSGRLSYGASANIIKTAVPSYLIQLDENDNNIYNWSMIEEEDINANFAYFKVVDGEITDILVILPKE